MNENTIVIKFFIHKNVYVIIVWNWVDDWMVV